MLQNQAKFFLLILMFRGLTLNPNFLSFGKFNDILNRLPAFILGDY